MCFISVFKVLSLCILIVLSFQSVIKILFHERRLQYMEKEQLDFWKQIRPGERILDLGEKLSVLCNKSVKFGVFCS